MPARWAAEPYSDPEPSRSALAGAGGRLGEALVALGRSTEGVRQLKAAQTVLATTHYAWDKPALVMLKLSLAAEIES